VVRHDWPATRAEVEREATGAQAGVDLLFNQSNWELNPNPDPNNRKLNGPPGCDFVVPSGPEDKVFQSGPCHDYQ
jgi:hypothetical protein